MIQSTEKAQDGHPSPVVSRQVRTLRILKCLQSGPAFNARELSEMLNVSRRTIYRDLQIIRAAGIAVDFDGEQGAYLLAADPVSVISPVQLGQDDVAHVLLAAHLSCLQSFPDFAESSRELLAKALTNHPPDLRNGISRMLNACTVEMDDSGSVELLDTLLNSIKNRQWLRLQYLVESPNVLEWTRFAPYHIVAARHGLWKVEGRSAIHSCIIRLSFDEIVRTEATEDRYRLPRGYRCKIKQRYKTVRPLTGDMPAECRKKRTTR